MIDFYDLNSKLKVIKLFNSRINNVLQKQISLSTKGYLKFHNTCYVQFTDSTNSINFKEKVTRLTIIKLKLPML